jgi:HEAT repeat protein
LWKKSLSFIEKGIHTSSWILLAPALVMLRFFFFKSAPLFFPFFLLILLGLGFILPYGALLFLAIFWIGLGFSFLHQKIHQEKFSIIEGFTQRESAQWLKYGAILNTPFFLTLSLFLFVSLILLLREATLLWGSQLFDSTSLSLSDWGVYALDLVLKAVFFDIPEIYHLDLSTIEHQGFWGATLVFISRLIILVLILGSLLRVREIGQVFFQALGMLAHFGTIAEVRLLLILEMYPSQIKKLSRYCLSQKLPDLPYEALIEILGKTRSPRVFSTLAEIFQKNPNLGMKLASLRGMEYVPNGDPSLFKPLFQDSEANALILRIQACSVLGKWKTTESLNTLKKILQESKEEQVQSAVISALGQTTDPEVAPVLFQMMINRIQSKDLRFTAKEALQQLSALPESLELELEEVLQQEEFPDNRRFAAMTLGHRPKLKYFLLFHQRLISERDADTQTYLIQGLGEFAHRFLQKTEYPQDLSATAGMPSFHLLRDLFKDSTRKIFVRIAALQTLVDFSGIVSLHWISESEYLALFQEASKDKDTQIADAAGDALQRLSPQFPSLTVQRDNRSITAVLPANLLWRSPPPET